MTTFAVHRFIHKTSVIVEALLIITVPLFISLPAKAQQFITRTVVIGSAIAGSNTTHNFSFTIPSVNVVGSIAFEYCTNSPFYGFPCTAPAGLDVTGAVLSSQGGNTGFTVDVVDTTTNRLVITRPAAAGSAVASNYNFSNIINPSTVGQTTYVRIASYSTLDGSGPQNDYGAVAMVVGTAFIINAFVPPYLTLCVGVTVAINCSSATGSQINFGELGTTITSAATTQFSGATNDPGGYVAYLGGQTMTSGNHTISALSSNGANSTGAAQFGLNLRGNTVPAVGADPDGIGTAAITANYNIPDSFRFVAGESLVSSPLSTDFRRFTVSYIVNIPTGQPVGVYTTTLTYTAIAAF